MQIKDVIEKGTKLYSIKYYDKAIESFEKAISNTRNNAPINVLMGDAFLMKGNYDKAIEFCDKAIVIDPNYVQSYFTKAAVYESKGDNKKKVYFLKEAAKRGDKPSQEYLQKQGLDW